MFWSKIWFFLVALLAVFAATIALVMPRPAERDTAAEERSRLVVGCSVVRIELSDNARKRVGLVSTFARDEKVIGALTDASAADKIDDDRNGKVKLMADQVLAPLREDRPAFAMLIDRRGRVVARVGLEDTDFGDVVAGRPLVDDALAGYLRDDIWVQGKNILYFVSASPVIKRETFAYSGAVLIGYKVSPDFAAKLVVPGPQPIHVGFFIGNESVATSDKQTVLDAPPLVDAVKELTGDRDHDCDTGKQVEVKSGNDTYNVIAARLPGEAGERGAYVASFTHAPDAVGVLGTIGKITKADVGFGQFPWILVIGGFVVMLGIGIGLMVLETDRPLRRLSADTVRLAKGEIERLSEDAHGGKFGSIARSINIHIDKLGREAKSAKKDLDQLLGPAPEGSLGTIDLLATSLPSRPGGAAPIAPPPPSEFRFGDPTPSAPTPPPMAAVAPSRPTQPPPRVQSPPPMPGMTPAPGPLPRPPTPMPIAPPVAAAQTPPSGLRLEDDILGSNADLSMSQSGPLPQVGGAVDPYFKQVYDQFIAVKKTCGEPTSGLTYDKFSAKLVKNRDDLKAKTGCREVKFTVYVKDGKAALKATPVKED